MTYVLRFLIFAISLALSSSKFQPLPEPYTEHCIVGEQNLYPPPSDTKVPWFDVDLDESPLTRWRNVTLHYKEGITTLLQAIKNLTGPIFHGKAINWVDTHMGKWDTMLPSPYSEEIKGIADALEQPLGELVMYNIFYELFTVCTSIVAEDPNGVMYHARNLDFGLFLGWDYDDHKWVIAENLRKIIFNVNFMKGGKVFYKSTSFGGFVGLLSVMKPNQFTITMNERFDLKDGGYKSVIDMLRGKPVNWVCFHIRDVVERANSYDEAMFMLQNTTLGAPAYFIVGGAKSGEAAVVTRSRADTMTVQTFNGTKWFLLQTNYDNWKDPLYLDDRRTPGDRCMNKLGQAGVGFEGIFNVLSSKTNLNKLTTYTTLMQVNDVKMEAWVRSCPNPCWPF